MKTVQVWQTTSANETDTHKIAYAIGKRIQGGEIIELVSDLGGGKTAFVRGLAQGMGSQEVVHSPSFTISNQYQAGHLVLYHFDFYRLQEPGIMRNELSELVEDKTAVIAVEWPDMIEDVLPIKRLTVTLQITGEISRNIRIEYSESLKYLMSFDT